MTEHEVLEESFFMLKHIDGLSLSDIKEMTKDERRWWLTKQVEFVKKNMPKPRGRR